MDLAVKNSTDHLPMYWNDTICQGDCYLLDESKQATRDYFWSRLEQGYFQHNMSIFWLDAAEPEIFGSSHDQALIAEYSAGTAQAAGMMFPYWHTQAVHDGLVSAGKQDGDIIMLARSAWAGSQRFGAVLWSGDTQSTWDTMKVSLNAGLNTQLSGIAWWTTDIGGYANGDPADPAFRELVTRWFQYGATCPIFRQHGWRETEIWKYGDAAFAAIKKVINWRKSMKGYVMEQMRVVSETGTPVNRPLWWDFPEDAEAWNQTKAFMFGPKFLMSPITDPNVTTWTTYLPAGAKWQYYFDQSKVWSGGQEVTVPTPLDEFPLFQRLTADVVVV
jgi:alpha-D-xyloside xylohydrolase